MDTASYDRAAGAESLQAVVCRSAASLEPLTTDRPVSGVMGLGVSHLGLRMFSPDVR